MGFLNGLMGTIPAIVMRSRAAFYAYAAATHVAAAASRVFGSGVMGLANIMLAMPLILGVAAVAFGVIMSRITDTYDATEQMRKSMDRTEQGFRQIRQPINDAQIALEQYNQTVDRYNELADYRRHIEFEEQKRGGFAAWALRTASPMMETRNLIAQMHNSYKGGDGTLSAPKMEDAFRGVAPGDYNLQTKENAADTSVHVYVNVNKDGSISTHSNNTAGTPIPVTVKQTGWPQ
jgi:hypothetical protein